MFYNNPPPLDGSPFSINEIKFEMITDTVRVFMHYTLIIQYVSIFMVIINAVFTYNSMGLSFVVIIDDLIISLY